MVLWRLHDWHVALLLCSETIDERTISGRRRVIDKRLSLPLCPALHVAAIAVHMTSGVQSRVEIGLDGALAAFFHVDLSCKVAWKRGTDMPCAQFLAAEHKAGR